MPNKNGSRSATPTSTSSSSSSPSNRNKKTGGGGLLTKYFLIVLFLFGVLTLTVNTRVASVIIGDVSTLETYLEDSIKSFSDKIREDGIPNDDDTSGSNKKPMITRITQQTKQQEQQQQSQQRAGQVGPGLKSLTDARIAAAKMLRVIERSPEIDIDDTKNKKRLTSKTNKDNKNAHSVDGEIVFENMHFKYLPKGAAIADGGDGTAPEGEGKTVFGGCNLTMKAGETVALGKLKWRMHYVTCVFDEFHSDSDSFSALVIQPQTPLI